MPVGPDAPLYRGRGYSSDIPTRYADRIALSREDIALTSVGPEVALLDARVGELLRGMELGESGGAWKTVGVLAQKLRGALESGADDLPALAAELVQFVFADRADAWLEIERLVEQRRKLVDTERQRDALETRTLSQANAQMLIGALHQAVLDEISDDATRERIGQRFRLILNAGPVAVAAMDEAEGRGLKPARTR